MKNVLLLSVIIAISCYAGSVSAETCTDDDHPTCTITCPAGCMVSYGWDTGFCYKKCVDSKTRKNSSIKAKNVSHNELIKMLQRNK